MMKRRTFIATGIAAAVSPVLPVIEAPAALIEYLPPSEALVSTIARFEMVCHAIGFMVTEEAMDMASFKAISAMAWP